VSALGNHYHQGRHRAAASCRPPGYVIIARLRTSQSLPATSPPMTCIGAITGRLHRQTNAWGTPNCQHWKGANILMTKS
jgi:hypothetical protein